MGVISLRSLELLGSSSFGVTNVGQITAFVIFFEGTKKMAKVETDFRKSELDLFHFKMLIQKYFL